MCKDVQIKEERISSIEYIEFLKRTDLGSQYPKERFEGRIAKLVDHVSISLVARNRDNQIVGVLFGLTDYAYWLYVTDLGVDRNYLHQGIGTELMKTAHSLAGGEKEVAVYLVANDNAGTYGKAAGRACPAPTGWRYVNQIWRYGWRAACMRPLQQPEGLRQGM